MKKDVVIIVGFDRPEYMEVTLSILKKTDRFNEMKYLFALDYGYSKKNIDVIERIMKGQDYEYIFNNGSRFGIMKQSYNILESYRKAVTEAKEFVFLIEDDIFCAKSFFTAHYEIHQKYPDLFCSTVCWLQNEKKLQTLDLSYAKTTKSVYQSLGVCFRKDVLKNMVLPHANPNYYRLSEKYLYKEFKNHFLKDNFSEQDGLIRRVHDTSGLAIGYPNYPRAFHAGIWGYHRRGENINKWSHEQKVEFIYETCFSNSKMQKYNQYNDVFITDLSV